MTARLRVTGIPALALAMTLGGAALFEPRSGRTVAPRRVLAERVAHRLTALGAGYQRTARSTADPAFYELAGRAFERALRKDPEYGPALLGSGELALPYLQRLRARFPDDRLILGIQTRLYSDLRVKLRRVEALDPPARARRRAR